MHHKCAHQTVHFHFILQVVSLSQLIICLYDGNSLLLWSSILERSVRKTRSVVLPFPLAFLCCINYPKKMFFLLFSQRKGNKVLNHVNVYGQCPFYEKGRCARKNEFSLRITVKYSFLDPHEVNGYNAFVLGYE